MTPLRFAFTKLVVADLDASKQFYIRSLGLSQVAYVEFGDGFDHLQEVILAVPNAPPGAAQLNLIRHPNRPTRAPGDTVIGFMVDDVDATVASMCDAGGRITLSAVELSEHDLKLAYVTDLDGHVIEVMQTL